MSMFSLRAIIDDILLIVRNNDISESEDLSRAQIAAWVMQYKAMITKQKQEKDEAEGSDGDFEDSIAKTIELELKRIESKEGYPTFTRMSVKTIDDVLDKDSKNIIAVYDQFGCVIQEMNELRRHYHWFRKYTANELTYSFEDDKHLYIHGNSDNMNLKYVQVKYLSQGDDTDDEEDILIPGWMIPQIKDMIFKNELSFMIKMPSDDDNNSTLDGIKPHGPQDQEK